MITLKSFAFGLTIMAPMLASAQLNFDWAISQGSKVSDFAVTLQQDDQGHLYTFGIMSDTVDLDPGIGEDILIPTYEYEAVLSKWTTQGEYLWSNTFQGPAQVSGSIMQVKDNQLLLYLNYTDSLVYEQEGTSTTLSVNPGENICILKLDLDGHVTFFKDLYDGSNFYFAYLKANDDGQIIAGGGFYDSLIFQTASGELKATSKGKEDAFIAYFGPDFLATKLQTIGSKGDDYVENLYVADDKAYFAIVFEDTLTIEHGQQTETFPCNGEANGLFGYLTHGSNDIIAYSFGGDLYDEFRAIAADKAGNIYVSGDFEGEVNFEHPDAPPVIFNSVNESDGFVSKYTPDGHLVWTRIFRDSEYGGLYTLQLQRDNSLYLSGSYTGHTDLDPGPDSIIVETQGWGDVYAVKFDTDGNMKWVYSFTGPDLEGIRDLIVSPEARVFIFGFNDETLDADPSENVFQLPYYGGSDMFLIGLTEENVITALADPSEFKINLYPNPSSSAIVFSGDQPIEQIKFYAINGTPVNPSVSYVQNMATADISILASGLYIAKVKTQESYSTLTFVRP